MTVTVLVLQTWFDLAVQYTGSVTNAYAIALANNRSITDEIASGEVLQIPATILIYKKEVLFLESKKVAPATGITTSDLAVLNPVLGIGTMEIGSTFIVA
jgi:hypothetical protein